MTGDEGPALSGRRRRILFICGSLNQTTQMHQVARELREHEHAFTPYYCEGALEWCRRAGLLEFTIIGEKLRERCVRYLEAEGLPIDYEGRGARYDLVVTCSDLLVQRQLRRVPFVVVQEGILDPPTAFLRLCQRYRVLPRWLAGTATTGLSLAYARFCVQFSSPGPCTRFRASHRDTTYQPDPVAWIDRCFSR